MQSNNIDNTTELEKYYFKNIFDITRRLKTTPIVWQELFDINTQLDSNVVVQVWKDDFNVTVRKVSTLSCYTYYCPVTNSRHVSHTPVFSDKYLTVKFSPFFCNVCIYSTPSLPCA